jgi:limonene-1,2-epoxide hydrolase
MGTLGRSRAGLELDLWNHFFPVDDGAAARRLLHRPTVVVDATWCEDQAPPRSDAVGGPMNPEEVVRAHLEAQSSLDIDQSTVYLADDATFVPAIGLPTYSGIEEIRNVLEGYIKVMTKCDIEIVNLAVAGNVVLTERIDHVIFKGKPDDAPGMGTFEVNGDKITAWRDYFAMGAQD